MAVNAVVKEEKAVVEIVLTAVVEGGGGRGQGKERGGVAMRVTIVAVLLHGGGGRGRGGNKEDKKEK